MIYKTFKKVSNVCQVLDKSKYPATQTDRGITFTNNGDGSITVNGTATGSYYSLYTIQVNIDSVIPGHIYAILGTGTKIQTVIIGNYVGGYVYSPNANSIYTLPKNEYTRFVYEIRAILGYTYSNVIIKPQLFDLTEMYGAGHEPTTVEQFRQDFPDEMYDYSPHCFVKSYKDCLKVSDVCQLLDKSKYPATTTINGVTFTNNGDGTITVEGNATNNAYIELNTITIKSGHKYLINDGDAGVSFNSYCTYLNVNGSNVANTSSNAISIYTAKQDILSKCYIRVSSGIEVPTVVFKPQLFDLTEMYGAGNEPTTVAQFRQDFPEEMYDYKPYSIIPSYKKSLVCKTKNLFDISKLTETNKFKVEGNSIYSYGYPIVFYDTSTLSIFRSLKPNTNYTMSAFCPKYLGDSTTDIALILNNRDWIHVLGNYKSGFVQTTFSLTQEQIDSINSVYFYGIEEERGGPVIWSNTQIEEGNTATPYVPYGHL